MALEKLFIVGEYIREFNIATGQQLPCGPIYQSYGLKAHIIKRHPDEVSNLEHVADIISCPDYIGKHPNEPDSLELVKVLNGNVMECIKLDKDEDYLFVASVYEITESKLRNRLMSGRLRSWRNFLDKLNTL